MIHDATFTDKHKKKAAEYFHSTASEAAGIALQANTKQLALVHLSPRYASSEDHEKEAKAIFLQSFAPNDLESIDLGT